jgi:hypothetical protein
VVTLAEPTEKSDIVVLRIPRGGGSLPVVRVVIGGVASRHALPVDSLDDLQLAVETMLREEPPIGGDVTLDLWVEHARLKVVLAGLTSPVVLRALSCGQVVQSDASGAESVLRMILDALVDDYGIAEGATAGSFAVQMEKRIA